jgi:hypothetical protein
MRGGLDWLGWDCSTATYFCKSLSLASNSASEGSTSGADSMPVAKTTWSRRCYRAPAKQTNETMAHVYQHTVRQHNGGRAFTMARAHTLCTHRKGVSQVIHLLVLHFQPLGQRGPGHRPNSHKQIGGRCKPPGQANTRCALVHVNNKCRTAPSHARQWTHREP